MFQVLERGGEQGWEKCGKATGDNSSGKGKILKSTQPVGDRVRKN